MNAAAYTRVSTSQQDLGVQLDEIKEFLVRRGWKLVATYSDVASGAKEDRTDFRRLMADAAKRKFEVVIVQRFDRAARSVQATRRNPGPFARLPNGLRVGAGPGAPSGRNTEEPMAEAHCAFCGR